ncbi:MAG TPA: RimK family alpha-L-glutamate ligase [Bacilli bacterium]|nr:RimK family alpha-L-glutamate ligase [Bacilli bacterium]
MEKVWFFYSNWTFNRKMQNGFITNLINKAKNEYNIDLEVYNLSKFIINTGDKNSIYYKGKEIKDFPKYAISRKLDIFFIRQLEMLGVKVFNSSQAMVDAKNKLKTHQILTENGIRSPKTLYSVRKSGRQVLEYEDVAKILNSNTFILKYIKGRKGKSVFLIDNKEIFEQKYSRYHGKVIFQEFISSSFGMDIRCYVVGDKFIGSAIRKSGSEDFRSNLAQGGKAIYYEATPELKKLVIKVAKVMKLDICGIDILIGKNNDYYVCEVNSVPGFKSLKLTRGMLEEDIFLKLLKDKINEKA